MTQAPVALEHLIDDAVQLLAKALEGVVEKPARHLAAALLERPLQAAYEGSAISRVSTDSPSLAQAENFGSDLRCGRIYS